MKNVINKKIYVEGRETVNLLQSIPSTKQQWHVMIMRKVYTTPHYQ